jgi:hypothetical protein
MPAEIIPPGEEERRYRRDALRRRIMAWGAVLLGIALIAGIVAIGFVVLAVAALVGVAAGLVFALLRWIERQGGIGPARRDDGRTRIEIITARGETLDGGVAGTAEDDDPRRFR